MDISMKLPTNSNLYGPSRFSAKTDVKDLLLRDSVLQKGEWDSWRHNPWTTTCSHNFKPLPLLYDSRKKTKTLAGQRHMTSMVLGNADNLRVATTFKDFDRKWTKTAKAYPDMGTSIPVLRNILEALPAEHRVKEVVLDFEKALWSAIPSVIDDVSLKGCAFHWTQAVWRKDFSTKFMTDKKFGHDGSIYVSTYNEAKKVDAAKNAGERKQLIQDLRTTHFDLGSTRNNYDTEAAHRYRPSDSQPKTAGPSLVTLALQESYQSNVFRNGDWNVTGHPSVRYSVTRDDFHVKPFVTEEKAKSDGENSLRDRVYKAIATKCISQGIPVSSGLMQAFAKYDVIKSGYLSRDQIKAVIFCYVTVPGEEIDRLIDESCALADGKVDYLVFIRYLEGSPKSEAKSRMSSNITGESYTGTHYMKSSYPDTSSGKPQDDPNHPYYHIATHFKLGDHGEDVRSLYYKDYMMGKKEVIRKPFQALPPMSSQVLPEPERSNVLKSTKQSDFLDPSDKGKALAQQRDREVKRNQNRLSKLSVEISSDPKIAEAYRQASVSGADYPSPPSEFQPIAPRRAPQSRYRYLETNAALMVPPADPYLSEQNHKFTVLNNTTYKGDKVECLDRIGDNRSSHFGFGSNKKPTGTEQHHEFFHKSLLDHKLPAAGKVETSDQNYSHVYPSESSEKEPRQPEATLDDVTLIQERLKEMNRIKHSIPRDPNTTDVQKAFLEFDPNMTGRISKQNVRQVCDRIQLIIPDGNLQALFDRCDQDRQGNIDYYQFIKNFTQQLALTKGSKPPMTSVMKTDFCPPKQRRFTSAQQRSIDVIKPLATMDSHYFHCDPIQERTPRTTTRHDFARPDRLPGEKGLNN